MAKKKNKWVTAVVVILCIVIFIGGGLWYVSKSMEKATALLSKPGEVQVSRMNILSTVDGSGYIAAADSFDIKIPSGLVISETLVEVGDVVSEGDIIANIDPASITTAIVSAQTELDNIDKALEDTSDMSDYEIEEYHTRQDYLNNKIEILTAFYLDPVVVATQSGVVTQLGSSSSSADAGVDVSDYTDLLGKLDPGTNGEDPAADQSTDSDEDASEPVQDSSSETGSSDTAPSDTTPEDTTAETSPTPGETPATTPAATVITDLKGLVITAPVSGAAPQSSIEETDEYTGSVIWLGTSGTFDAGTVYTAMVTLEPKPGYAFGSENDLEFDLPGSTSIIPSVVGGTCFVMVTFEATEGEAPSGDGNALPSDFNINDFIAAYTGSAGAPSVADYAALYNASNASNLDALAAAYSGSGSSSGRPSTNTSEDVVISIAETDEIRVSIEVDELDILGVEEGQTATVTCIAIPDREFTGTIVHISNLASNGTTKYTVDIALTMDPDMRFGMSADASITVGEASNVLTIPMNALQQRGDETFVFTSVNEDGSLGGEVVVSTGVSDGTDVEITSGLNEGDTVYFEQSASEALSALGVDV